MDVEKVLLALTGTLVGIVLTRFLSRRKERIDNTLNLAKEYHSSTMLVSRVSAWHVLQANYPLNPKPFHKWFSSKENFKDPDYESIVTVIYFWYRVLIMKRQGIISSKLARELLGYQWEHWKYAYTPLVNETLKDSDDCPEWLILFQNNNMKWIEN